jgi:protein HIRA/HIR1
MSLYIAKVTCSNSNEIIFSLNLNQPVTMICASQNFICLTTLDSDLQLLSLAGRRLFPQLHAPGPLSYLCSCSDYLMAITSLGGAYIWYSEFSPLFSKLSHI